MATVKEVYKNQLDMASVRLVKDKPLMSKTPIRSPEDAVKALGEYLCQMDREVICVINLRTDGIPINCSVCSMGAIDQAIAHPREIMKTAILSNAVNIVMMHNHPSSNLNPSKEDSMITDRMLKAGELIGIQLVDHIIVGGSNENYFSFREKGLMEFEHVKLEEDYLKIEKERFAVAEAGAEEITAPVRRKRSR